MAKQKTFTTYDLEMGVLRLNRTGSDLSLMQGYKFLDNIGDVIPELPSRVISENAVFTNLPVNVQDALITIFTHMHDQALVQEGME
jgi:hypothetical protein